MDLMGSKQDDSVAIEMTWDEFAEMVTTWRETAYEMYRDNSPNMTKEDRESNKRYYEHWLAQEQKVREFIAKAGDLK
jgi:hypothetical protein